jgi:hypothetical protein
VLVVVSLLTPAPADDHVRGLTFGGDAGAPVEPRSAHFVLNAALSVLLLATVAAVWLYFR